MTETCGPRGLLVMYSSLPAGHSAVLKVAVMLRMALSLLALGENR
jgi:hypothetical protein